MVADMLALWDEEKIRACGAFWMPGKKPALQGLLDSFSDPAAVTRVLQGLPAAAAQLYDEILQAGETLTRSRLGGSRVLAGGELDQPVAQLQERALIFIFKNRMKLDNGMDRLEPNPHVREVLLAGGLYLGRTVFTPEALTLDAGCSADPAAHFSLSGGVLPAAVEGATSRGIVFSGGVFRQGSRLDGATLVSSAHKEGGMTLTGVLAVSLVLSRLRKKPFRLDEDARPRARDMKSLAAETGMSAALLADSFFWAQDRALLSCRTGSARLTDRGEIFLRSSLRDRLDCLYEADMVFRINGEESPGQLFRKWLAAIQCSTVIPEELHDPLDTFSTQLRRSWLGGRLALVLHSGRVTALRSALPAAVFQHVASSLLVTGGCEVHVLDSRISPLQELLLRAFGDVSGQGEVRTVTFSETSIRRGLLLGFSGEEFLAMLRAGCDREPPAGFLFSLEEWVSSFERVEAGVALILRVSEAARELFFHDRELSTFYIGSLDDGTIAVSSRDREKLFALLERRHIVLDFVRNENAP